MKRKRLTSRISAVAALALTVVSAARAGVIGIDPRIDDRMIVHLAGGAVLDDFIAAFETNNPTVSLSPSDVIPGRPVHLLAVQLPPGATEQFVDQLEADLAANYGDLLLYADFLYENQAPEGKSGSTWVDGIAPVSFENQYAAAQIGLPVAHARTTGLGSVVAVLDTGIDPSHPALAGHVLPGGWDFTDGDADPADTGDGLDNDGDTFTDEMTGHGTFVSGLILLVAPDASLLPVRVLDSDGVGDEWRLTQGLYFAIDRGVEVINLSLGSTYDTNAVRQAIVEAATLGIVVVSSAGNLDRSSPREYTAMDDVDPEDPTVPQLTIIGAFGVAAVDHTDVKADFSNFNRRLFISAPGANAPGPIDPDLSVISARPGGTYAAWEGTSFATAFVSGAAALVRAQHPEWPPTLDTYLEVQSALTTSAVDIYPLNPLYAPDTELGVGRLDAGAAAALGPVTPALGDLDNDGSVGFADLLKLLGAWGETHSSADLDGDGTVAFGDLLVLIGNWG